MQIDAGVALNPLSFGCLRKFDCPSQEPQVTFGGFLVEECIPMGRKGIIQKIIQPMTNVLPAKMVKMSMFARFRRRLAKRSSASVAILLEVTQARGIKII